MGLSKEQEATAWAELKAMSQPRTGVEVVPDDKGRPTLIVDGAEVWTDGASEPEDCIISRDLAPVVDALRSQAARICCLSESLEKERAIASEARRRAEEAELGCDVLATGDPYERLRDTLEASRLVANERDQMRARAGDLALVVHALLRRLKTDDTELTHSEVMAAAEDCHRRELFVVETGERLTAPIRLRSWLKFR